MKIRIVSKETDVSAATPKHRKGEAAVIYADLCALMRESPDDKAVVDFERRNKGYRVVQRMANWAAEDGLQLYAAHVHGSFEYEMYLGPLEAK